MVKIFERMKKIYNYLYTLTLLLASCVIIVSCSKDELNYDAKIEGLGGEVWEPTAIDNWLTDNYVKPYNVEVKYKWDQFEIDLNAMLVPPKEEKIIPVMSMIKDIWISPYETLAGSTFIKVLCPKKYVLVGSPRYNSSGTITLGEAEGGRKITIYRINRFESGDIELIQSIMKTVHHEFAHTMHQTKLYPQEYMNITPGGYTSSWNNVSDETALKLGYISSYACASPDEDFAEMIARILIYGRKSFEERVAMANKIWNDPALNAGLTYNPGAALKQKEAIIITYLKDVWGVNLYDPSPNDKGLETLVQEAIDKQINS